MSELLGSDWGAIPIFLDETMDVQSSRKWESQHLSCRDGSEVHSLVSDSL